MAHSNGDRPDQPIPPKPDPKRGKSDFCLTINNPAVEELCQMFELLTDGSDKSSPWSYIVAQLEVGEEKHTQHMQCYAQATSYVPLRDAKALFQGAHIELRKSDCSDDARLYCMKEDTRIMGPWEYGAYEVRWKKGTKPSGTDFKSMMALVKEGKSNMEIFDKHPGMLRYTKAIECYRHEVSKEKWACTDRQVEVVYICGSTGSGKTRYVYDTYGYKNVYRVRPPSHNKAELWFDDYEGQETLFLDEFNTGWVRFRYLLQLIDRYPISLNVKGSSRWAGFTRVIIAGTVSFDKIYPNLTPVLKSELTRRVHIYKDMDAEALVALSPASEPAGPPRLPHLIPENLRPAAGTYEERFVRAAVSNQFVQPRRVSRPKSPVATRPADGSCSGRKDCGCIMCCSNNRYCSCKTCIAHYAAIDSQSDQDFEDEDEIMRTPSPKRKRNPFIDDEATVAGKKKQRKDDRKSEL